MSGRPNILLLLTDDQRFDTIHALGNQEILTPNLDRLAKIGTTFTQAHIPGGTSAAVCMPSRAMLHTGRTLFHIGREGQDIPDCQVTLGEAFRKAGYHTFGTGKWHNGLASFHRSFSDGGNIFFGGMWDHWNVPFCDYDPSGQYDNLIQFTPDFANCNHPVPVHCDHYSTGQHSTEVLCDTARQYIENHQSQDPFLLSVAFLAPHDPRTMPDKFRHLYQPENISLPENFMPEHPFDYGVRGIRDEVLAAYPRSAPAIRTHLAEYYAMITHLDDAIGRILAALERSGQAGNTIVVLTGDNGLAVGQHGLMGKQSLYEHSIRVPLIFSGPGIPQNLQIDQYAYLLDIFPTLCDLTGIGTPESVEGTSLRPIMANATAALHETLYFAYRDQIRAVKDNRYKLIEYVGAIRQTQLFDLVEDPWERYNLFGNDRYAEVVNRLRSEMAKYRVLWENTGHPLSQSFWDGYDKLTV